MSMETDLYDFRGIRILVDRNNNLAIFPMSKSDELHPDGINYKYFVALRPIEVQVPYNVEDLAEIIREGFNSWNQYQPYTDVSGKDTFEEKHYGIKGFKNAILGKRFINLGWNYLSGKQADISWPLKRGYGYFHLAKIKLRDDADYLDFAGAVINLVQMDLTNQIAFKKNKKLLLLE